MHNSNRKYDPQISSAKSVWRINHYQQKGLSFEDFYNLSQQPCYYCGRSKLKCHNIGKRYKSPSNFQLENGNFFYNGIDKLIPTDSYELSNLVPCCWECNKAKETMNNIEFINLCKLIAKNHE